MLLFCIFMFCKELFIFCNIYQEKLMCLKVTNNVIALNHNWFWYYLLGFSLTYMLVIIGEVSGLEPMIKHLRENLPGAHQLSPSSMIGGTQVSVLSIFFVTCTWAKQATVFPLASLIFERKGSRTPHTVIYSWLLTYLGHIRLTYITFQRQIL